jgi:hypothetical protein
MLGNHRPSAPDDDITVTTDYDRTHIIPIEIEGAAASLPAAEEVRSPARAHDPKRKNRYIWIAVITTAVMIIIIANLAGRDKGSKSNSALPGFPDPEKAVQDAKKRPRPSLESVIAYLTQENVSNPSLFQNKSSWQYMAARFMAETDGANLAIPTIDSRVLDEGYYFVFRYVMIVFYYAMQGNDWTINPGSGYGTGFLTPYDACYWFEPILKIGVWCVIDERDGTIIPLGLLLRTSWRVLALDDTCQSCNSLTLVFRYNGRQ